MDAVEPGSLAEYLLARKRIEQYVAELAAQRGIPVRVRVDPGNLGGKVTTVHAIALTVGSKTSIASVDHASFLDEKILVGVSVLPQIEAAVNDLVSSG